MMMIGMKMSFCVCECEILFPYRYYQLLLSTNSRTDTECILDMPWQRNSSAPHKARHSLSSHLHGMILSFLFLMSWWEMLIIYDYKRPFLLCASSGHLYSGKGNVKHYPLGPIKLLINTWIHVKINVHTWNITYQITPHRGSRTKVLHRVFVKTSPNFEIDLVDARNKEEKYSLFFSAFIGPTYRHSVVWTSKRPDRHYIIILVLHLMTKSNATADVMVK